MAKLIIKTDLEKEQEKNIINFERAKKYRQALESVMFTLQIIGLERNTYNLEEIIEEIEKALS